MRSGRNSSPRAAFAAAGPVDLTFKQKAGVYFKLTKPWIMILLLLTTLTAMFIAAGGAPGGWLFVWTMIGGYLAAGGANAINHYVDRDIDGHMRRTDGRTVVAGRVTPLRAMTFGIGWKPSPTAMTQVMPSEPVARIVHVPSSDTNISMTAFSSIMP